jgi:hypothetical protein
MFTGLYFFVRLKKTVLDLILLAGMVMCSGIFVLWPELTNRIAHWLGVGRGSDLVFYLSILIFWFVVLKLYARIRILEKMVTEVMRNDALQKVIDFSETNSANNHSE